MMSNLELVAVALGLANLTLLIRRSVWNYPFGIAMVSLYAVIFFDAKLYSETALQGFFFAIQIYGWMRWRELQNQTGEIAGPWSSIKLAVMWLAITLVCALGLGAAMERLTDAAAPYPDAFITAASVSAQILLVMRRVESWIYWVVIDAVVYDMTSFLPDHPGGKRLPLKYAGRDATAAWDSIHGHKKAQILEQWSYLRVGVVAADAGPPPAPEKSRRSKL